MHFGNRESGWGAEFILEASDVRRLAEHGVCEANRGLNERSRALVLRSARMSDALAEIDEEFNLTVYLPDGVDLPVTIEGNRIVDMVGMDRRAREHYLGAAGNIVVREVNQGPKSQATFLHQNKTEL